MHVPLRSLFISALVALALVAPAQARPQVLLTISSAVVATAGGHETLRPADHARAGERLRFTISAKNVGDRPALNLMPIGKIPPHTVLAARGDMAHTEASLDGGTTWATHPLVRTVAGGVATVRPATAAEITALRWVAQPPLFPRQTATFTYDVLVE